MSPDRGAYFATRLPRDDRRAAAWRHISRFLAEFIPPEAAVMELGAGYCDFINAVAAKRRVAVDIAPELRDWAGPAVETVVADAEEFLRQASAEEFDFLLASNFFEHFEWPQLNAMIPNVHRVLRPGGRLAVIQPNYRLCATRYFDDYTHRAVFSDVSLVDWLTAAGFRIIRCEPRFLPLTVKSRLGGMSFLIPFYLALPYRPLAGQMFVLAERPA